MVRYYCNSPAPGGAGIDWMNGYYRLKVDTPDESGTWPEGRIEVVNGGGGNGGVYMRILPEGGRWRGLAVVAALQGESHHIVGDIGDVQIPKAQILAIGRSEVGRREPPHENLVVAAWIQNDQVLMIEQVAGRDQWWWVFSAHGAERFSRHYVVPGLEAILGRGR